MIKFLFCVLTWQLFLGATSNEIETSKNFQQYKSQNGFVCRFSSDSGSSMITLCHWMKPNGLYLSEDTISELEKPKYKFQREFDKCHLQFVEKNDDGDIGKWMCCATYDPAEQRRAQCFDISNPENITTKLVPVVFDENIDTVAAIYFFLMSVSIICFFYCVCFKRRIPPRRHTLSGDREKLLNP